MKNSRREAVAALKESMRILTSLEPACPLRARLYSPVTYFLSDRLTGPRGVPAIR